jgi:hypothetical protein
MGRLLPLLPLVASGWNDRIGPFYSTTEVARLLGGISRQEVAERRKRRTLLALKTADDVLVYPAFQFDERHRLLPGLTEVLKAFPDGRVDEWTLAGWLVSPLRSLEGESVRDWLRAGKPPERAVAAAQDAAHRFAA